MIKIFFHTKFPRKASLNLISVLSKHKILAASFLISVFSEKKGAKKTFQEKFFRPLNCEKYLKIENYF